MKFDIKKWNEEAEEESWSVDSKSVSGIVVYR